MESVDCVRAHERCVVGAIRVALANEKRNALKREGDSSASMKALIAAAQVKQRAKQNFTGDNLWFLYRPCGSEGYAVDGAPRRVYCGVGGCTERCLGMCAGGSGPFVFAELDKFPNSMVCSPSPSQRRGSSGLTPPVQHGQGGVLSHEGHKRQDLEYTRYGEAAVDTEATIARDTFVGMLETVSRTKDSIGRTTRQAMDCAKHGIAEQVSYMAAVLWRSVI